MGYLVLEYMALLSIVLALGALSFGASVMVLVGREAGKQVIHVSRQVARQAKLAVRRIAPSVEAFFKSRTDARHQA